MKLTAENYFDERKFVFTFFDSELSRTNLDQFDRRLLTECEGPDATVADRLLALELIARRIEEAA